MFIVSEFQSFKVPEFQSSRVREFQGLFLFKAVIIRGAKIVDKVFYFSG